MLLIPGEVAQLLPDDEVVMVSSVAQIKAKKLRYYTDANFKRRVPRLPAFATVGAVSPNFVLWTFTSH